MKFDMNHDISDDVQIVVAKPQEQNQENMRDIMKKLQNDLQSLEKLRIEPVVVAQVTKPTEPAKMKELMKKIREDMKKQQALKTVPSPNEEVSVNSFLNMDHSKR